MPVVRNVEGRAVAVKVLVVPFNIKSYPCFAQVVALQPNTESMYGGLAEPIAFRSAGYVGFAARKLVDELDMVCKAEMAADSLAFKRARSKFGIAIAANNAIMATTIMISTRVNPFLFNILSSLFGTCLM